MSARRKTWLPALLGFLLAAGVGNAQLLNRPAAPLPPPIYPGAAKVVSLTGQVSVLRDSYPWALQVGDAVQPQQVILTGPNSFAVFQLSDGSTFHVFPNSRVTFRNNPGNWKDLLDLWIGRVKVFIQKFGDQPNRNRIFTPTAIISVRGTVFDVVVDDEDTTLVSVEEGAVDVRHRLIGESKSRLVHAGEYIRVYKNEPIARQRIDKGALMRRILRASADAFYTIMIQHPRTSVPTGGPSSTGGGPTLPGDTGGSSPPPSTGGGGTGTQPTSPPVPPPPPPPPPSH